MKTTTVAKKGQNYLTVTNLMLATWLANVQRQNGIILVNSSNLLETKQQKFLPHSENESRGAEVKIDYSQWENTYDMYPGCMIEYIWGVRCGLSQVVNEDDYSFASALAIARTDEMCEIYSPGVIKYCTDGSRKIIPHQVACYNIDASFSCWNEINIDQAKILFPEARKLFALFPLNTKLLLSPDESKIRIGSEENGEIGISFVSPRYKAPESFYLGGLRATFAHIADEIEKGNGLNFCSTEQKYKLDFLDGSICFLAGGRYDYEQAMKLAKPEAVSAIRKDYIQKGIAGNTAFWLTIDGSYIADKEPDLPYGGKGNDRVLCVPPSVYKKWGRPFTKQEKECIHRPRTFKFTDKRDKIRKLRRIQEEHQHYRIAADLSGPTRSSIYTVTKNWWDD